MDINNRNLYKSAEM